jgi:hypothetical protein
VNEDGTPVAAVTIVRTGGSDGFASAMLTPSNGTATAGIDFRSNPISVGFANGETSKTVIIPIVDDTFFESNESVNLILSNPTGGAVIGTQRSAVLNIIDNDFKPTLSVNIIATQQIL